MQRLDERLGLVLKELEEARAVRAKYNRALRSTNYASVLEESMRRIESLKGTPDTSLEPSAASVGA